MANIVVSGDWWRFEDDGTLYVYCTGDMPYSNTAPWNDSKTNIISVVLSDGVTNIGAFAFLGCTNLTSVTIPDSVTSIGQGAFAACNCLTSVTIPDSVTSIGQGAFATCVYLSSIQIPNGVTSIATTTFSGCTGLTEVTIPDSVTSIGNAAFRNCSALTDVYYGGTEEQWGEVNIDRYNEPIDSATMHYSADTPAVVIPTIPVAGLGNPLAAVVQTLNFVIQNLNTVLASSKITEIIMNGVSKGTSGVVNLGTVLTQHQNISGKADVSTVNTLIGSDTGKSVRTIANEELAAQLIPANAQEALDTLQEISAWIQSHPGEVADINRKLTLGIVNGTEYATVKAYVEAMVSGLITFSALSATVTGTGNAVTGVSYDNTAGVFSFTKALTFLTEHQDISGKVDKVTGKALSTNDYTDADKAAVETIGNKVDKVTGKALSTNDYTTAEKNKLSGIAAEANKTIIDDMLSNTGEAADAKATGDHIAALQNLLRRMEIYCNASGNPATFYDAAAANIKALSVTLTPTQSGSGDPSPSNVRPITGVSSVRVTRTGKNLFSFAGQPTSANANGVTFVKNFNADGSIASITLNGTNSGSNSADFWFDTASSNPFLPVQGSFYISLGLDAAISGLRIIIGRGGGQFDDFTTSGILNGTLAGAFLAVAPRTTLNNVTVRPVAMYADIADRSYEPPQRQTQTVALVDSNNNPLTVYGGTLDVTSGTLTVEWENIASYNGETLPGRWISDRDVYASGNTPTTGAQVVYELATPVTYTLTPQQFATLPGYNAVSSKAGSVSVTYKADPVLSLGGGT